MSQQHSHDAVVIRQRHPGLVKVAEQTAKLRVPWNANDTGGGELPVWLGFPMVVAGLPRSGPWPAGPSREFMGDRRPCPRRLPSPLGGPPRPATERRRGRGPQGGPSRECRAELRPPGPAAPDLISSPGPFSDGLSPSALPHKCCRLCVRYVFGVCLRVSGTWSGEGVRVS